VVGMGRRGDKNYVWIVERPIGRYPRRRPRRRENNITVKTGGKYTNNMYVKLQDNSVSNVGAADVYVLQSIQAESALRTPACC